MALITKFNRKPERERMSTHQAIEADYIRFERDGRILLQIDMYGRKSREFPHKQSQVMQLDRDGASQLYAILKRVLRGNLSLTKGQTSFSCHQALAA